MRSPGDPGAFFRHGHRPNGTRKVAVKESWRGVEPGFAMASWCVSINGNQVMVAANPAPNTAIFDGMGILVIANEQTISGTGVRNQTLTVNAISITFTDVIAGGTILNGRIEIGHVEATLVALPPCQ